MLIPDQETAVDFLNYEAIAKTVVVLLKGNQEQAVTIGIHGDWGAGKSSVLRMVETGMSTDRDVAVLWFNGWAFQGFEDAKTALIEVIVRELIRKRSGVDKVKKAGAKLLKRLDYMKLAKHGAGLAFMMATGLPSPMLIQDALGGLDQLAGSLGSMTPEQVKAKLEEAAGLLKPSKEESVTDDIHRFREEFKTLLSEADIKQLVVMIDDLDRCLPATAIDTLEAIRLFLFVEGTAFIIGADEGMIEYAVRQHFPNLNLSSGTLSYTRSYLEKLIQVPFRIPALGVQESRTYVTLLLVQAIVGEKHEGFKKLLENARVSLNQPWLGASLSPQDVQRVDEARRDELNRAFVLAQQIGPILAEGTKGNPRQLKRFLNSLAIRQAIAKERGFAKKLNAAVLGKLMLAERFQQDFYDYLATVAMSTADGTVKLISELETEAKAAAKATRSKSEGKPARTDADDTESSKWLSRDWLATWAKIEPSLIGEDLRPYVFVARDKKLLAVASGVDGLEPLLDSLRGGDLAARKVEQQVKALPASAAEQIFAALSEHVMRAGDLSQKPPGFEGLMLVAKHHPPLQPQIVALADSIADTSLGAWVTRGWAEILTDKGASDQFRTLLKKWAAQEQNGQLKVSAEQSLSKGRVH